MSDVAIAQGINSEGRTTVIVDGQAEVQDLPGLLAAAPALSQPSAAADLARAVAHLAAGSDYRVITDTSAFEAAYRAKLDREDPAAPWQEGVFRLRDHGVPDFSAIHAPVREGDRLVFFAQNTLTGLPYRADLEIGTAQLSPDLFRAVTLRPLPAATSQPTINPEYVGALGTPAPLDDDNRLAEPPLVIEDVGEDDEPDAT